MPYAGKKLTTRAAGNGGGPAGQVRPDPVQDEHLAVSCRAGPNAAVHSPASCCARQQSRGRRGNTGCAPRPQTPRFRLAPLVCVGRAGRELQRQCGPLRRLVSQVDGPQRTPDTGYVLGLGYLFMAQQLRPRTVRSVAEVVCRPLAQRMPSARWLRSPLPQKRIAGVGMAEPDHVAGENTRAAARSRTRLGPGSSGRHVPRRSWAGERLPSSLRGRWNQRRTPKSL